jgi:polar amino acid transport system substrate-binding protein
VILVPAAKAAQVRSLRDICGHTLAYATGTFGQQLADDVTTLCAQAHEKAPVKTAFPDAPSIQLALESGRISYEIEDTATGGYDAKVSKGKIKAIQVPAAEAKGAFTPGLMGVVVPKDQPRLAKAIKDALTRMLQDGAYQAILKKWGVSLLAVKKISYDTPSY